MLKKKVLDNINDDSYTISELAKKLKLNRVFLSGYLKALEDNGELVSKNIGTAKVYKIKEQTKKQG